MLSEMYNARLQATYLWPNHSGSTNQHPLRNYVELQPWFRFVDQADCDCSSGGWCRYCYGIKTGMAFLKGKYAFTLTHQSQYSKSLNYQLAVLVVVLSYCLSYWSNLAS